MYIYYSAYTYIFSYISIYIFYLGNSDDGSIGVIVGVVIGGIVGIILGALTMILWHHCKMYKKENIPGNYI